MSIDTTPATFPHEIVVHYERPVSELTRPATEEEAALHNRGGEMCYTAFPAGWVCTRTKDHDGNHIAHQTQNDDGSLGVVAVWSTEPTPTEPTTPTEPSPFVARFAEIISKLDWVIEQNNNVTEAQLALLHEDELRSFNYYKDGILSRRHYATEYMNDAGNRDEESNTRRLNTLNHVDYGYLPASYREMFEQAARIEAAAERARGTLLYGRLLESTDEGHMDSVRRGKAMSDSLRFSWATQPEGATVADVLAYWQHRHTAMLTDIAHCSNTIRAAARAHGWHDLHQLTIEELRINGELTHPLWHAETRRPVGMLLRPVDGTEVLPSMAAIAAPPLTMRHLHDLMTVQDMVAAITAIEELHSSEINAMAERLRELADSENWCGDYENNVNRLNSGLSMYMSSPFIIRQREYHVSGHVTVTITVPISQLVEARDIDDAYEEADQRSVDTDEIAAQLGISYRELRNMNYEIGNAEYTNCEQA
jgi:hypothetical protein